MKLYGSFEKVEDQDDGTLIVSGYASSESVDSDGEVIKASAMADAIPDYMRFGAVREMHQASAAGTALAMRVDDDGRTAFEAHVVDPIAVKKVKTGTYKGFSIGGKVTGRDAANKAIITGISLVEVSLVDRPANPAAVFTMYKADGVAPIADDAGEPGGGNCDAAEPVAKSLGSVASMASLLQSAAWIAQDSAWEAEYEGDRSAIPARLKAWLAAGGAILTAMTAEEVAEAVADVPEPTAEPAAEGSAVALAAPVGDVQKAAATPDVPNDDDRLTALIAKALESLPSHDDTLAKAVDTAVEKATAPLLAQLDAEKAARATLEQRVEQLAGEPAPPKGVVRAVTKAEDTGAVEPTPVDVNDPVALMKAAQSRPVFARSV